MKQVGWKWGGMVAALLALGCVLGAQERKPLEIGVDWGKTIQLSRSTPTLQVVVNPELERGARLHDGSFAALKELGADYVRYVPWLPYPKMAVAELEEPKDGKTSWDFAHIDPMLDDFLQATAGHSVILNFSTIPAWMFKTAKPVAYPSDPNAVVWDYTQGRELRDPSMQEVAGYYARLLSWYTKGGFTDEFGKWHASGHHYKIAYWELLNEIEAEHQWTPEAYTRFYDAVSAAMLKVDPELKFVALALAAPSNHPEMFEYVLNPAHHQGGAPIALVSYHFYAEPQAEEGPQEWQYTFFNQEEGFLNTVRYVEAIRKRLSPATGTDLDELGIILHDDKPGAEEMLEPPIYWNLAGALYADLYLQLARMGVDVVGESQLVGYPSQFPSVSMMNYRTAQPNARFWVLKLLRDHFGPGDRLTETTLASGDVSAQAFLTQKSKSLLVVNKRSRKMTLTVPEEFTTARVEFVAPSTGDGGVGQTKLAGRVLELEPNEVAVLSE